MQRNSNWAPPVEESYYPPKDQHVGEQIYTRRDLPSAQALEDKYLTLKDENQGLKCHIAEQEDHLKRLATKLIRLTSDLKRQQSEEGGRVIRRRDVETENLIEDLRHQVRSLKLKNGQLQDKVTYFRTVVSEQQSGRSRRVSNYDHVRSKTDTGRPSRPPTPRGSTPQRRQASPKRPSKPPAAVPPLHVDYPEHEDIETSERAEQPNTDHVAVIHLLRDRLVQAHQELEDQKDEISHLQNVVRETAQGPINPEMLSSMQADLREKSALVLSQQNKISLMDAHFTALKENHSNLIKKQEETTAKLREVIELEHAKAIEQVSVDRVMELNILIEDLRNDKKAVEEERDRLYGVDNLANEHSREIGSLVAKNKELQSALGQADQASKELRDKLVALGNENTSLRDEMRQLRNDLFTARDKVAAAETAMAEAGLEGGRPSRDLIEAMAEVKRQREGHVPRHEEVRRQMQRQLDTLNEENRALQLQSTQTFQARSNSHTTLVEANDKLKWTNMDLESEIHSLQDELDALKKKTVRQEQELLRHSQIPLKPPADLEKIKPSPLSPKTAPSLPPKPMHYYITLNGNVPSEPQLNEGENILEFHLKTLSLLPSIFNDAEVDAEGRPFVWVILSALCYVFPEVASKPMKLFGPSRSERMADPTPQPISTTVSFILPSVELPVMEFLHTWPIEIRLLTLSANGTPALAARGNLIMTAVTRQPTNWVYAAFDYVTDSSRRPSGLGSDTRVGSSQAEIRIRKAIDIDMESYKDHQSYRTEPNTSLPSLMPPCTTCQAQISVITASGLPTTDTTGQPISYGVYYHLPPGQSVTISPDDAYGQDPFWDHTTTHTIAWPPPSHLPLMKAYGLVVFASDGSGLYKALVDLSDLSREEHETSYELISDGEVKGSIMVAMRLLEEPTKAAAVTGHRDAVQSVRRWIETMNDSDQPQPLRMTQREERIAMAVPSHLTDDEREPKKNTIFDDLDDEPPIAPFQGQQDPFSAQPAELEPDSEPSITISVTPRSNQPRQVTSPQPSIPPPEEPLPNVALEDIYDDISDMAHNQESEAHEVGEGDDHILSKEKKQMRELSDTMDKALGKAGILPASIMSPPPGNMVIEIHGVSLLSMETENGPLKEVFASIEFGGLEEIDSPHIDATCSRNNAIIFAFNQQVEITSDLKQALENFMDSEAEMVMSFTVFQALEDCAYEVGLASCSISCLFSGVDIVGQNVELFSPDGSLNGVVQVSVHGAHVLLDD